MSLITQRHGILWAANNGSAPTPPTPVLPSHTIRCKFRSGYTPTMGDSQTLVDAGENIWDIYKSGDDWTKLLYAITDLTEVLGANTTGIMNMFRMFSGCAYLTSVTLFDTSSVTNMSCMFQHCHNLTAIPLFDTSSVMNMDSTFDDCGNLTAVPLFDTRNVKNMYAMIRSCSNLTSVPLFDTSSATDMRSMFQGCSNVESGALALYQQASGQATPPSNYSNCFNNCGSDTVTGAAELAQIPASWGGTGA